MKIFSISDIHASHKNIKNYQFLLDFLNICLVEKNLTQVIFLGDIFDHMVGCHQEFRDQYFDFFHLLDQLCEQTKVIFIEGNHDFNISELFENRYGPNLTYLPETYKFFDFDNDKKLNFIHGDLIDYDDQSYKIFRLLIRSRIFSLFCSNFLNFKQVEKTGDYLSSKSKKYGLNGDDSLRVLKKFRKIARRYFLAEKFNFLFIGHSHVKDLYINKDFTMINNGQAYLENSYIHYENGEASFSRL